ncbi:MAG: hypothetical protein ACRDSZ_20030 [Pseudonocardiaceae bacterium]
MTWWVDERQFAWFEARMWAELGQRDKSAELFGEALTGTPQHRVRGRYSYSVYLFESLVNVGDWREAEQLVPKLAPYISEVGSGRTASILRKTLHTVRKTDTTPTLEEEAQVVGMFFARARPCHRPAPLVRPRRHRTHRARRVPDDRHVISL